MTESTEKRYNFLELIEIIHIHGEDRAHGYVYGRRNRGSYDGQRIITSPIISMDDKKIETTTHIYELVERGC